MASLFDRISLIVCGRVIPLKIKRNILDTFNTDLLMFEPLIKQYEIKVSSCGLKWNQTNNNEDLYVSDSCFFPWCVLSIYELCQAHSQTVIIIFITLIHFVCFTMNEIIMYIWPMAVGLFAIKDRIFLSFFFWYVIAKNNF